MATITVGELRDTIAALRAVLAPLLDDPWIDCGPSSGMCYCCHFCYAEQPAHDPDCPVLRKDDLLGRVAPGATTA